MGTEIEATVKPDMEVKSMDLNTEIKAMVDTKIKVTKIKATAIPDTEINSMDPDMEIKNIQDTEIKSMDPDMETKDIPETDMAKMTTDTNKILMDQNRAMDTKRSPITITI